MIKVLIIEDEAPARKKLGSYLQRTGDAYTVVDEIETVAETKQYLQSSPNIDVIFSDIELRDGNVFEAYKKVQVTVPIIFATAYDKFWMNAFETNGIEYLLKPYSFARFEKAWHKYSNLIPNGKTAQNDLIAQLDAYYQSKQEVEKEYKEYLPVKTNSSIYFLKVEDIVCIQADYGVVFAHDADGKRHVLNQTSLKVMEELLNPEHFFKINRSELVSKKYIERIDRYTKNTLVIYAKSHKLKTSQNTTAAFNSWMGV